MSAIAGVVQFATELMEALPPLAQAGMDIASTIGQGVGMLRSMANEDRGPTESEYEALRALNRHNHEEFQRLDSAAAQTAAPVGASNPGAAGEEAGS